MAMCGSGAWITRMTTMRVHQRMAVLGIDHLVFMEKISGFCVAALGTTDPASAARLPAPSPSPLSPTSVSAWSAPRALHLTLNLSIPQHWLFLSPGG